MNAGAFRFDVSGRIVIVSGASRGIGHAIARGLGEAGALVTALGRSAAPTPPDDATNVSYRVCDVTDVGAFREQCAEAMDLHGRIDAYVHSAGVTLSPSDVSDDSERFARTVRVNLVAAFDCNHAVAIHMRGRGSGSIVNVTSINSYQGFPENPGYVASKGGLSALTRALALDLGPSGIRVNNLVPGYIRTTMTAASYDDPARHEQRRRRTILDRWGEPEDMVGPTMFLVSDASAYVTGQDLVVDGGWLAKGL